MRRHKSTGTGNTGQPSKASGVQLGPPRFGRKFCLNTCGGGGKFSSLDSPLTAEAFGSVNVHKANVTGMEDSARCETYRVDKAPDSFMADAQDQTAA